MPTNLFQNSLLQSGILVVFFFWTETCNLMHINWTTFFAMHAVHYPIFLQKKKRITYLEVRMWTRKFSSPIHPRQKYASQGPVHDLNCSVYFHERNFITRTVTREHQFISHIVHPLLLKLNGIKARFLRFARAWLANKELIDQRDT